MTEISRPKGIDKKQHIRAVIALAFLKVRKKSFRFEKKLLDTFHFVCYELQRESKESTFRIKELSHSFPFSEKKNPKQPVMGHGDLCNTEVIISHEAKLSGMYETGVWDKSHIL